MPEPQRDGTPPHKRFNPPLREYRSGISKLKNEE